jgi:hypothetical protein
MTNSVNVMRARFEGSGLEFGIYENQREIEDEGGEIYAIHALNFGFVDF